MQTIQLVTVLPILTTIEIYRRDFRSTEVCERYVFTLMEAEFRGHACLLFVSVCRYPCLCPRTSEVDVDETPSFANSFVVERQVCKPARIYSTKYLINNLFDI